MAGTWPSIATGTIPCPISLSTSSSVSASKPTISPPAPARCAAWRCSNYPDPLAFRLLIVRFQNRRHFSAAVNDAHDFNRTRGRIVNDLVGKDRPEFQGVGSQIFADMTGSRRAAEKREGVLDFG